MPSHPVQFAGITFPNPVGLSAGMDNNGDYFEALQAFGFGFIELGGVTPRPQAGNRKPRLFRLKKHKSLINCMGFPNKGVDYLARRLQQHSYQGVVGVNIGKNKSTPLSEAHKDYVYCYEKLYPWADYITINISSPNTPGLRELQNKDNLSALLQHMQAAQQRLAKIHNKRVPFFVKLAPDLTDKDCQEIAGVLLEQQVEGIVAHNTSMGRDQVINSRYAKQAGGLSGAAIKDLCHKTQQRLHKYTKGKIPIIGVGGIQSATDAKAKLAAGASLVQLYTGLVYQGPGLVKSCIKAMMHT